MRKISKENLEKKREKYAEGERQTLQLLELHPVFHEWIEEMQEKHLIDPARGEGMVSFESWREAQEEENPWFWDGWYKDIHRFRHRFRLTANYAEALAYYIVTGSFHDARTAKILVTTDLVNNEWVNLRINAPASKEEIMDAVIRASSFLNTRVSRTKEGKIHIQESKQWRPWKYRPKLDRDIGVYTLSQKKQKSDGVTDRDLVVELYPEDDDTLDFKNTSALDKKRARQLHVIRGRIDKALHERFPANTF